MKNIDMVRDFLRNNVKVGQKCGHLKVRQEGRTLVLVNYATDICYWTIEHKELNGYPFTQKVVINITKYSRTTSCIQNMIRLQAQFEDNARVVELQEQDFNEELKKDTRGEL